MAAPAISTVAAMGYFGFLAGPPLIGALAQASSCVPALLVAVVLLVISLPAGAVVLSNESRRAHSDMSEESQRAPQENPEKDRSEWVTGGEPMTGPQRSYLQTLGQEAGEPVPSELTKAQASELIERLQAQVGRGSG